MPPILVTGSAGFIGYHVSRRLLESGQEVVGFDCLSDYYDVALKRSRLALLEAFPGFQFVQADLADKPALQAVFGACVPDVVVNLAAQAGVRYSLTNPEVYVSSNLEGFANILECCRHSGVRHLVYASSSSVYGSNAQSPFSVTHSVDHPLSLYAATKKANELMAHTYSHLFGLPTTGLRFFTVYGPWGRPDMALYIFTRSILAGEPISLFNHGRMERDFTYIDDIVEGIVRVIRRPPTPNHEWDAIAADPATSHAPYRVYNIGNHTPVLLTRFVEVIEECVGRKAICNHLPMQPGDVPSTCADVTDLMRDTGFSPDTPIEVGVRRFVDWYMEYHRNGNTHGS